MYYTKKLLYRVIYFTLLLSSIAFIKSTNATDLETQKALDMISDFAERMCDKVPIVGSDNHLELSGSAKAELNRLLKNIADLGIDGAAKYQENQWSGILQKDIANIIMKRTDCKIKIWDDLKDKIILIDPTPYNTIPNYEPENGAGLPKDQWLSVKTPLPILDGKVIVTIKYIKESSASDYRGKTQAKVSVEVPRRNPIVKEYMFDGKSFIFTYYDITYKLITTNIDLHRQRAKITIIRL